MTMCLSKWVKYLIKKFFIVKLIFVGSEFINYATQPIRQKTPLRQP